MSEQKKRRRDCYDLDFHFNSYLFSIWKRDGTHFYMVLVFTSLSSTVDLLFLSFCCDLFFLHSLFPFPLLKYTHPAWVDPIQGNWQSESVREYFLCRDLCAHFGKSISLSLFLWILNSGKSEKRVHLGLKQSNLQFVKEAKMQRENVYKEDAFGWRGEKE